MNCAKAKRNKHTSFSMPSAVSEDGNGAAYSVAGAAKAHLGKQCHAIVKRYGIPMHEVGLALIVQYPRKLINITSATRSKGRPELDFCGQGGCDTSRLKQRAEERE